MRKFRDLCYGHSYFPIEGCYKININCIRLSQLFGLFLISVLVQGCVDFDPFLVSHDIGGSLSTPVPLQEIYVPPGPVTEGTYLDAPCGSRHSVADGLSASDVIHAALCRDPRSRKSWSDVMSASARLGTQYGKLLPSMFLNSHFEEGHTQRIVPSRPYLTVMDHLSRKSADAGLEWVLFDGGQQTANVAAAEDYFLAQKAIHNQSLLSVFIDVAQLYFRVVALQATVDAKIQAEKSAQYVFQVSDGRNRGGIAPMSDVLQAEAAYHQATLSRMEVEGNFATAKGQLATLMGFPANAAFTLRQPKYLVPTVTELGLIDELIKTAERRHPSILAAAAQLSARQAESQVAGRSAMPVISLTTDFSGIIRAGEPGLTQKARYVEDTIGIKITIPLSPVENSYNRRQAAANVAAARADLDNAELTVALGVWKSYQQLKIDIGRYEIASKWVSAGERSYAIATGRYQRGIGSILEVLNAQTVLANARQEQIEVKSSCYSGRLVLSASLGKLDFSLERE